MQLTVWTYEGPPHVGAMRIATAMEGVHYVLHAPQGDTYADLLFTMIERRNKRPPVTYTTFQARDLGSDTAQLFKDAARDAYDRFRPEAMIVGSSCTAELIQDDPGGLAEALALPIPVIPLELPSYQKKENWGAAETFYRLVRTLAKPRMADGDSGRSQPSCNILGPTALGFRHRDDVTEVTGLLGSLGVAVNVVAPMGARPSDLARLPDADFNVVLYPEIAGTAATYLERAFKQPFTKTVPIGVGATRAFIAEVEGLCAKARRELPLEVNSALSADDAAGAGGVRTVIPAKAGTQAANGGGRQAGLRLPWYSRSVDSTYLTGKRVFIFGDAAHVIAAARVASKELGFAVVGLGTYTREFARDVRDAAKEHGVEALITDDYLDVEAKIQELQPELVLGTQMERHVAKRLGIPCAVISAPVHVQDFPARYSPQMGFEGANVIFDTWVHPLMMGLEEHLLGMFRDDFEFHDGATPSHLGHGSVPRARPGENDTQSPTESSAASPSPLLPSRPEPIEPAVSPAVLNTDPSLPGDDSKAAGNGGLDANAKAVTAPWHEDAERELRKIPFFVRGKARRNTERFAAERGLSAITVETLYDAKAHFSR
jgi:light-independent protochlorophyllide reductase subunit B